MSKGCFDNIDHGVLGDLIGLNIPDGRFLKLLADMLKVGYMDISNITTPTRVLLAPFWLLLRAKKGAVV